MKPIRFVLDFRSDTPVTNQIVAQVRRNLVSGEWKPGDQLPTVRQLAADLRVNFNTVARAYRILDEAGLISTQQGRGTFILDEDSVSEERAGNGSYLTRQITQLLEFLEQQGYDKNEIFDTTNELLEKRYQTK